MYQKILVPLDGSQYSGCILTHVKAIAKGCSVPNLVLLRVIEPWNTQIYDVPETILSEAQKKSIADARSYLESIAEDFSKEGMKVSIDVVKGTAADVILDYAKKCKADLIMMSTKGQSGISRWTFGSVTDKVIRQSQIPVLVAAPSACQMT